MHNNVHKKLFIFLQYILILSFWSLENINLTSRTPTLVNDLKLPYRPLTTKEPTLVGDLKLPYRPLTTKDPTLVGELKLPIEKVN